MLDIDRNAGLLLVLICLLAGMVRLWSMHAALVTRDGYCYIQQLEAILRCGRIDVYILQTYGSWYPPLFFWLPFHLMKAGLSAADAITLPNVLMGALCPVWGYCAMRSLSLSKACALCAACITALHPEMIHYSVQPQREISYLFYGGASICCFLWAIQHRKFFWVAWIGCGFCTVIGFFLRFESLLFFLFFGLWWCAKTVLCPGDWKKCVLGGFAVAAGGGLALLAVVLLLRLPGEYWLTVLSRFKVVYLAKFGAFF